MFAPLWCSWHVCAREVCKTVVVCFLVYDDDDDYDDDNSRWMLRLIYIYKENWEGFVSNPLSTYSQWLCRQFKTIYFVSIMNSNALY